MTTGRRIYVDHQHFQIRPALYVTLVGRQALRKTSAKDAARDMFTSVFPDFPIGASVMSREQIVVRLASDDNLRAYTDEEGKPVEWRPMYFYINELKNFMSINPGAMVEFLTDIYDTKFFAADTIKHGLQPVINPCINILACETPVWIIDKLKLNIIAGGFSRRMIFVYETVRPARIPFPIKTKEAYESEEWCKKHLQKIVKISGKLAWTDEAKDFFGNWFIKLPNQSDPVLEGFYEAKDILVTKIAMLLAIGQPEPRLVLDLPTIFAAIQVLESIEDNLPKLTIAVGRNDLAITQQKLLQLLEEKGGLMDERAFRKVASQDLREPEYMNVKRFLQETEQIVVGKAPGKDSAVFIMLWEWYEKHKNGEVKCDTSPTPS